MKNFKFFVFCFMFLFVFGFISNSFGQGSLSQPLEGIPYYDQLMNLDGDSYLENSTDIPDLTGNYSTGRCSTGNCPTGNCSTGRCSTGNCPTGNCPTGNCPTGRCPTGNCPTGNCPTDGIPQKRTYKAEEALYILCKDGVLTFNLSSIKDEEAYYLLENTKVEIVCVYRSEQEDKKIVPLIKEVFMIIKGKMYRFSPSGHAQKKGQVRPFESKAEEKFVIYLQKEDAEKALEIWKKNNELQEAPINGTGNEVLYKGYLPKY